VSRAPDTETLCAETRLYNLRVDAEIALDRNNIPLARSIVRSMLRGDWRIDQDTRDFVREHPDGATLEEIAVAMGVDENEVHRVSKRAIRKLQRPEGAKITYASGPRAARTDEATQPDVAAVQPDDVPLREELYSPAGLRLHALADAMDHRIRCVHQIVRYGEVAMQPRRWYGPGDGWGVGGRRTTWLVPPGEKVFT
jgi:plasmid maintenance system antidote protein VapI